MSTVFCPSSTLSTHKMQLHYFPQEAYGVLEYVYPLHLNPTEIPSHRPKPETQNGEVGTWLHTSELHLSQITHTLISPLQLATLYTQDSLLIVLRRLWCSAVVSHSKARPLYPLSSPSNLMTHLLPCSFFRFGCRVIPDGVQGFLPALGRTQGTTQNARSQS